MIANDNIVFFVLALTLLQIYSFTYKAKYNNSLSNVKITNIPYSIKCLFNEKQCEQGDLDGWSLLHCFVYLCIGIVAPNKYFAVFIISIIFEVIQPYLGNGARFIINPLCNLTGYAMGSLISNKYKQIKSTPKDKNDTLY